MSETLSPIDNVPVLFPYPATEVGRMAGSDFSLPAASTEGHITYYRNTWMVDSGSSGEGQNYQESAHFNIDRIFESQLARPLTTRYLRRERDSDELDEEMDEEANEEAPLLSTTRVSRQTFRRSQTSYHLTESPESLDRKVLRPNLRAELVQPADQTYFGSMETRIEGSDGNETTLPEYFPSQPHIDGMVGPSLTPYLNDGSSNCLYGRHSCWHKLREFLCFLNGWLGRWFGCVSPRARSYD